MKDKGFRVFVIIIGIICLGGPGTAYILLSISRANLSKGVDVAFFLLGLVLVFTGGYLLDKAFNKRLFNE
jgi:hypothetical protein